MFAAVDAHTPPQQIKTFAFITAAPNPIGVGQQTNIVFWLDNVIAGTGITNNIRFHNYNLTITSPNGTNQEIDFPVVNDQLLHNTTSIHPHK